MLYTIHRSNTRRRSVRIEHIRSDQNRIGNAYDNNREQARRSFERHPCSKTMVERKEAFALSVCSSAYAPHSTLIYAGGIGRTRAERASY